MSKRYKKCLYIHGLHTVVNQDKVKILKDHFTEVVAPQFDYGHQPDSFQVLRKMCMEDGIDFIVGSSFGGYLGYHLSKEFQLPAILFNPALFIDTQDNTFVTEQVDRISPYAFVVIGDKDKILPKGLIDEYIEERPEEINIKTVHCRWLPHSIDLATFESMIYCGLSLSAYPGTGDSA